MYPNTKVGGNETARATIDEHNLSMLSQLMLASLPLVFFFIKHRYCYKKYVRMISKMKVSNDKKLIPSKTMNLVAKLERVKQDKPSMKIKTLFVIH
jgi:hypothetical protein